MGESKQVKVDNWGIFFLQRLQTFFNKTFFCDLTLQFEDNVQLKVHRLVLNACTEYFQVLEQTCDSVNDCLIMPPDLQADVVVPIVNFMYSGILEFQISTFDRLYATARLMNMTVLTKLLDAQKVPISPIPKPLNKRPIAPITWNLQGKKIAPKTMDPDLPEQLPGRKLPIWKRKSAPASHVTTPMDFTRELLQTVTDPLSTKYFRPQHDEPPKPTRFDWPEDDAYDTQPFDEISYTSKPILLPSREKSPKPSTSNFDEVKRSAVKRAASPVYNDNKKMNIQDVKEYIKEQKIRSDYNDYDDSEAADNDLQTFDDNDSDDDTQNPEETRGILKNDTTPSHNKRVRFSLEGKENAGKEADATSVKTSGDVTNHTKIITEVLKKFPQLVQKNKNIRLKILAKGQNAASGGKSTGTPVKVVKPLSKVSYMVHKPAAVDSKSPNNKKDGQWSCQKCSETNPIQFDTYHSYRLHLTETHNEKTDSQMCNICGHVSRKQNMLMYHKYVKHNIEPPAMFQFPKCKECSYIALTPSLLIKHQYNHTHQNLVCVECHIAFSNKTDLIRHIQTTGHSGQSSNPITTFDCAQCPKKFISSETLNQHIRNNHKEAKKKKDNIITVEEIDALEEQRTANEQQQQQQQSDVEMHEIKQKENKIKILSDIKVNKPISTGHLLPVDKQIEKEEPIEIESSQQQLEPSSEAESLSNVASGIAASLGLVNTIVVLDENNQFILQDGSQASGTQQNFILPENIQNLHVSQHQVISTDSNSIITQAGLSKNSIGSTDELVMVLTDHDYSDAANNTVLTSDNSNIVVLYSHPVQGQDGQFISQPGNLMLNANMGLVEVSNNYGVANDVPIDDKTCDESIEMIQQEINNHLEEEVQLQKATGTFQVDKQPSTDQLENVQPEDDNHIPVEVENNLETSEKMDVDPYEPRHLNSPLPELNEYETNIQTSQETTETQPLPGIQTIPTTQKYIFIPTTTTTQDMHGNIPEMQENIPEMQESMPEIQEDPPQDEHIPGPDLQDKLDLESEIPNEPEVPFDEPMEVEESVEMVQQEINRQQLEREQQLINEGNTSCTDVPPDIERQQLEHEQLIHEENTIENGALDKTVLESRQEDINERIVEEEIKEGCPTIINEQVQSKEIIHQTEQEESVENIEKELNQEIPAAVVDDTCQQEECIEQMEVDSSKQTIEETHVQENTSIITNQLLDLNTEEITSPENFETDPENTQDNFESTESNQNNEIQKPDIIEQPNPNELEHIENISEIEDLQNAQSTDAVDSGVEINPTNTEPDTYAEISQLSESESLPQTVDEVSDLPQDTNSSEIPANYPEPEHETTEEETQQINDEHAQKINSDLSKKPFRISMDDFHAQSPDNTEDANEESTDKETNQTEEIYIEKDEATTIESRISSSDENINEQNRKENESSTSNTSTSTATNNSTKIISSNMNKNNRIELSAITKSKISNLLDDWDDGDTDSQQSDTSKQNMSSLKKEVIDNRNSINTLINDWEDEED